LRKNKKAAQYSHGFLGLDGCFDKR